MQNRAENSDPRAPVSPEVVNARFQGHLDLVDQVARGFMTRANAAEHDDMLQEGRLALLRASESYRPGLGVLFPAYAATAIRNALIDGARKRGRRTLREVMSLDAEQNGGTWDDASSLRVGDSFEDLQAVISSLAAEKAESRELLNKAILRLSDRHRFLIRQVLEERTLTEIGDANGISKQAAAKAFHAALAQLKQELHALGVKGLAKSDVKFAERCEIPRLASGMSNPPGNSNNSGMTHSLSLERLAIEDWAARRSAQERSRIVSTVPLPKQLPMPSPATGFVRRLWTWFTG